MAGVAGKAKAAEPGSAVQCVVGRGEGPCHHLCRGAAGQVQRKPAGAVHIFRQVHHRHEELIRLIGDVAAVIDLPAHRTGVGRCQVIAGRGWCAVVGAAVTWPRVPSVRRYPDLQDRELVRRAGRPQRRAMRRHLRAVASRNADAKTRARQIARHQKVDVQGVDARIPEDVRIPTHGQELAELQPLIVRQRRIGRHARRLAIRSPEAAHRIVGVAAVVREKSVDQRCPMRGAEGVPCGCAGAGRNGIGTVEDEVAPRWIVADIMDAVGRRAAAVDVDQIGDIASHDRRPQRWVRVNLFRGRHAAQQNAGARRDLGVLGLAAPDVARAYLSAGAVGGRIEVNVDGVGVTAGQRRNGGHICAHEDAIDDLLAGAGRRHVG